MARRKKNAKENNGKNKMILSYIKETTDKIKNILKKENIKTEKIGQV